MDKFPDLFCHSVLERLRADKELYNVRPLIVKQVEAAYLKGETYTVVECSKLCNDSKIRLCEELCGNFNFVYGWDASDSSWETCSATTPKGYVQYKIEFR
jgi:hypothetical protein